MEVLPQVETKVCNTCGLELILNKFRQAAGTNMRDRCRKCERANRLPESASYCTFPGCSQQVMNHNALTRHLSKAHHIRSNKLSLSDKTIDGLEKIRARAIRGENFDYAGLVDLLGIRGILTPPTR